MPKFLGYLSMWRIYFAMGVGIVSISFAAILIKLASEVPSIIITAYRLSISSVLLILYSLFRSAGFGGLSAKEVLISALGGLFLAAHFTLWIASIKYTSIPSSVTLVCTSPIYVGIFSYLILKERQDRALVVSIVMSIFGSILLTGADGGLFMNATDKKAIIGDLLAILGAIAVTGYFLVGSYLRRSMDTLPYITLVYTFSALFSLFFAAMSGEPFVGYHASSYIYMFLLAVIPQLLGHTSFNWVLKYTKTSAVSISTLGEPIGSTILAYLFFHTTVNLLQAIGVAIILVSIFVAVKAGAREAQ